MIAQGKLLRQATVADLRGHGKLCVVAEPLSAACAVAERLLGAEQVTLRDGALNLHVAQAEAPRLTRELVLRDIAVRQVCWHERSLEEIFFELTAGANGGAE